METKGTPARGAFHGGSRPRGLFPLDQAHDAHNLKAEFAGGLDGLHGGGSGGADIIDDDDARALFAEAFDALSGAVSLFGLAHQEAVDPLLGGEERRRSSAGEPPAR